MRGAETEPPSGQAAFLVFDITEQKEMQHPYKYTVGEQEQQHPHLSGDSALEEPLFNSYDRTTAETFTMLD